MRSNPLRSYCTLAAIACLLLLPSSFSAQTLGDHKDGDCNGYGPGESNTCSIDVTCSEGLPWIHEQRSVVWHNPTGNDGEAWSASFVNNVHEDTTKYILTARHVDGKASFPADDQEFTEWLRLGYHFTTCSGSTIDEYDVIQASWVPCATGILGTTDNDFSLLQVVSPIPADVDIYFSGWSAEDDLTPASGAVIGHPCGDCQKITIATEIYESVNKWEFKYESGSIQTGNSGGPGYDEDHRIIAIVANPGSLGIGCATSGPRSVKGPTLEFNWEYFHTGTNEQLTLKGQLGRRTTQRTVLSIASYDFDIQDLTFTDPSTDYGRGYFRTVGDITVEDVTVEDGGELKLLARGSIRIDGPFEAQVGSTLKADVVPPATPNLPHPTCYPLSAPRLLGAQVEPGAQTMQRIEQDIPTIPTLDGNYPNPFAQETRFRLALPSSEHVKITILDILGREVATIMNEDLPAGIANIIWYGRDVAGNPVASGTYFYRIEAGDFVETGSVTVVR